MGRKGNKMIVKKITMMLDETPNMTTGQIYDLLHNTKSVQSAGRRKFPAWGITRTQLCRILGGRFEKADFDEQVKQVVWRNKNGKREE